MLNKDITIILHKLVVTKMHLIINGKATKIGYFKLYKWLYTEIKIMKRITHFKKDNNFKFHLY